MATLEDVLAAVAQLGDRVAGLEAGQQELRAALEKQGQELRDHIDHAVAIVSGELRKTLQDRFEALSSSLTVTTGIVMRLDNDRNGRFEIDQGLLQAVRGLQRRVDRIEDRLWQPPDTSGQAAGPS
jgi:hypothetical protein